jgi:murein DD-endopeptidase MepM/ murein hydrolase activator NlpD
VYATAYGIVREIPEIFVKGKGYGKCIIIDHDKAYSTRSHSFQVTMLKREIR